jgi:hypothetical protein
MRWHYESPQINVLREWNISARISNTYASAACANCKFSVSITGAPSSNLFLFAGCTAVETMRKVQERLLLVSLRAMTGPSLYIILFDDFKR